MKLKFADFDVLTCPHCGSENLHQLACTAFWRVEDAKAGTRVHSSSFRTHVETDQADNPSSRRDGIRITFECEECPRFPAMSVVQHKGCTIMQWESRVE